MDKLLILLTTDFPQLQFTAGQAFCWSPKGRQVTYKAPAPANSDGRQDATQSLEAVFSLLHETGHALLEHKRYALDFELLQLEVAAWQRAKRLGEVYGIAIDDNYIEDCLDTYRDWLYSRSVCPSCTTKSLQLDDRSGYQCYNCGTTWKVAVSRFRRSYRKSIPTETNKRSMYSLR